MTQMTLMREPERRRRWSDQEQREILAAAFSPGAMVADVSRRFDVSTRLIYGAGAQPSLAAWHERVQMDCLQAKEF